MKEGKYIFSGIRFGKKEPELILDSINEIQRIFVSFSGQIVTIQRYKSKYCIGRYDLISKKSMPCPDNSEIFESSSKVCRACFVYNSFNPSFYNSETLSKKQELYNKEPHFVYLAFFADNILKIGIANSNRGITRLLEQGARSACILTEFENAYEARELEVFLIKKFKLKEALTTNMKIRIFKQSYNSQSAKSTLQNIISTFQEELQLLKLNNEVVELNNYYGKVPLDTFDCIDVSENSPLIVSGNLSASLGSIMYFKNDNRKFICSAKKLLGHKILFTQSIKNIDFEPIQTSLF